jgi:glucose/arabinose dehydrogenase
MRRRVVAAVALATLVPACGGGGGNESTPTTRTRRASTTTTTAAPTTTTTVPPNLDAVRATLTKVADVAEGTALVARPGDAAIYVALQPGQVMALHDGRVDTALDISGKTQCCGEQGLLGIVFSRDGNHLYAHSTALGGDTRVEEYAFTPAPGGGGTADPASARLLLTAPGAQSNHNGGQLALDGDGRLYIGLGDGGAGGDEGPGHAPGGNGQSLDTLLGKILRIDPTASATAPYTIPPDNPFANGGGRPEIWSYGLRNPWRFSIDAPTDTIWIGDVGQNAWEEVDSVARASSAGANFGWNPLEGTHEYRGGAPPGTVGPLFEYSHDDGSCTVIGGYVYRGEKIAALRGAYVFSDYCNSSLHALYAPNGAVAAQRDLGIRSSSITSFGVDNDGELYVVTQGDGVFRLDPA